MARLQSIAIVFPEERQEDRQFFMQLAGLFAPIEGAQIGMGQIMFSTRPGDGLPLIALGLGPVDTPQIVFGMEQVLSLRVGNTLLANALLPKQVHPKDLIDGYQEERPEKPAAPNEISLADLTLRMFGHITRIDHLGINLPTKLVSRDEWEDLLKTVSAASNLYRYPSGEDWPFILPASAAEFAEDIASFADRREPKFEFVYDTYAQQPVIQIDVETDLRRAELEELMPEPYATAFPGLAEYFRSAYLAHPWEGLLLRFDMRYRSEGPSDWDTGEWLVKEGGRIR